MTERETHPEVDETDDPAPAGGEQAGSTDSGRPGPFRARLRERFGPSIDPHISLGPPESPDPDPALAPGADPVPADPPPGSSADAPDGDGPARGHTGEQLPAEKRLERLGRLMPAEYRYKFKREIGRGGMGAVLEVRDRDLDRRLAMKVIAGRGTNPSDGVPTDRGKIARFLEEAQITGQLNHPGIVPVHEIGMDARGRLYFTMLMVQGKDLKQVFAAIHGDHQDDPDLRDWTLGRALGAVLRVCETMAFAHTNGVIHRDLKPSNVMVGSFGETYVMDWGLAKVLGKQDTRDLRIATGQDASGSFVRTDRAAEADLDPDSPLITMDGTVVGTPAYMAPEQAKGQIDKVGPQSDVYSVGAILYHLLTGRAPYGDEEGLSPMAVLTKVIGGPPARVHTLAPDAPAELCAICEKAMSYSRKGRYETMLELAGDLQAYLAGRVVTAHETGSLAEFKKWVERNRPFAAVIAIAVLSLLVTLGRIGYIQNANNKILEEKNTSLVEEGLRAQRNAREAQANAEAARDAQLAAEASDRASRRQGYLASVLAATSSLRLDETEAARQHLAQADEEFAGWELDHLRLATDTALATWASPFVPDQRVAWSRDGLWIANLSDASSGSIELRRAATGEVEEVLAGHQITPSDLAFSVDGRWLASASRDRTVRLWNTGTGEGTVVARNTTITELAFTPDGRQLAGAGLDGHLWLWDLDLGGAEPTATLAQRRRDEGGALSTLAVDPDGRWLATGTEEGLVRLWSLTALRAVGPDKDLGLMRPIESDLSGVTSLTFAEGGELLAIATADGRVRVASTTRMVQGLPMPFIANRSLPGASASDSLFLPDGRLVLACTDGVLRVLRLADADLSSVHGHGGPVTSLALAADGSRLLSGSSDSTLRLWSCYALLPKTLFTGHKENIRDVAFSPDGGSLATASDDGTAWIWEAASGEVTHILRGHDTYVRCLAYSPDGEWLATGSGDRTVRLWDAETGDLFTIWEGHGKWIADLAFSPDSRYLATASGDGTCRVWDVEEERCLTVFEQHGGWVHCVAWNEAGTLLLSGGTEGRVLEWDPFTGQVEAEYQIGGESVTRVAWGPDGHRFTAGCMDGHVRVVDPGGRVAVDLPAHDDAISAMTLGPDRLLTGDRQGRLRLWDPSDWEPTIDLHVDQTGVARIYGRQVAAVGFSDDGRRIASARGKLVRVWESTSTASRHEAMLAARRVVGLVDDLFNDLGLPSLVIESLREDRDIPGKLREAAIRSVTAASQDPELLVDQAWTLIRDPDADPEDHENALVLAQLAIELSPTEGAYRCALAAACVRTGDHVRARELLEALLVDRWHTETEPHPEVLVLLAMAEYHLGLVDAARVRLDAIEADMARPLWQQRAGDLYDEARALVAG